MSSTTDGNKIIIPIEVLQTNKEELHQILQEIQTARDQLRETMSEVSKSTGGRSPSEKSAFFSVIQQEVHQSVEDAVDEKVPESAIESGGDDESGTDFGGLFRKGAGVAGIGTNILGSPEALGADLVKFIPYIGEALIAWGIAQKVIDIEYGPGGFFDTRYKRDIQSEIEGYFTREQQSLRRTGIDSVIVTSTGGFRNLNGANVENTLREVRFFGVSRIGLQDRAMGYRP